MNKIIKKIGIILILLLGIVTTTVNAATVGSFSVSPISKEVEIGQNLSITITTKNCAGQFSISSSNSSVVSVNESSKWIEGTETIALTVKTAGTATITITAENVGDNQVDPEDVTGSKTVNITVKAKEQPPVTPQEPTTPTTPTTPEEPQTPSEPEKPTTPTEPEKPVVKEPKFTDVNKTMYATGDINLRASWSTSSAATKIEEGTELKVTGTSTEKVNGYIWYRVSYNGATKYVASSLLTDKKVEKVEETQEEPQEEKKSDNANLKSLTIEGQELVPAFNKETTEYTMQVTSDITELNIKAEAEDEKASVEIQGNKDLKVGENIVTITVNAEDNTIKIYEIKVTKSEEIVLGLKSLVIKDTDIYKSFKTDIYEYEIDIKDVLKLEIEAIATDDKATVEILGNEDLQEGENIITIIVSSEDGEEKVTYQITANKAIAKIQQGVKKAQPKIDTKIYIYIGIGAILLIALIIVIVYTIKNRNNEEEFDFSDNYEGDEQLINDLKVDLKEESNQEIEQTQEINYNFNEVENNIIEENKTEEIEEEKIEDRKVNIDYFLDSKDDEEKPRRKKGKHF